MFYSYCQTKQNQYYLSDVDLTMEEGRIYGLVGNNGSGKTMLMKCICGFVLPTKGTVLSNGKKIGKDMDYLQDAGVIIENPGFISYYSGLKNLKLLAGLTIPKLYFRTGSLSPGSKPQSSITLRRCAVSFLPVSPASSFKFLSPE